MCSHELDANSPSYPLLAGRPIGKRIARLDKDGLAQLYSPGQWEKVNLLASVQINSSYELANMSGQHAK
jgi:alpha-mannosidase